MPTVLATLVLSSPVLAREPEGLDWKNYRGPEHHAVDLLRASDGGPRIYVEAVLPDGEPGIFMIDTGADISVLSRHTAERLGLHIQENYGSVMGLSGVVDIDRAILPSVKLGDVEVPHIEVAVGVPGVATSTGALPLDGLLGNNVWSRFVVELDYPADTLVLHAPGSVKPKRRAGTLYFNGAHLFTPLELRTTADPDTVHTLILRIDTGASELSICGRSAAAMTPDYTEGLETVQGIGAGIGLPAYRNLKLTRRITLERVSLGGTRLDDISSARWLDYDNRGDCPEDLRGLVGHDLLDEHRVLLDYAGGRFHLAKSRRKPRQNNVHRLYLERDLAEHGDDPRRAFFRARLRLQLEDFAGASRDLQTHVEHAPTSPEAAGARVLLANLARLEGQAERAADHLAVLDPGQLVDHAEIIAAVNATGLDGSTTDARALAEAAVEARPESGAAWVALADARLRSGDTTAAEQALREAVDRANYPDAHLLRRARVALAGGDRHGSHALVRKRLALFPMDGEALWFYATLAEDDDVTLRTFSRDMEHAMARLHPRSRPLDFMVAARARIGDQATALELMERGIARDCEPLDPGPRTDNCLAWYWSLAGVHSDEALQRVERALAEGGSRPDYLDTKAMVHLARREYEAAREAALAAVRLSPDNVYMLWQADRLSRLAEEEGP